MNYVIMGRAPREREWEEVEVHNDEQAALDAIEVLERQSLGGWQFRIDEAIPEDF